MEIKDINTIEDIRVQRMYLQLQELKIILNNAKDSVTGKILLDCTLEGQIRNILESLLEGPKRFIDACVVLSLELGAKKTVAILNDKGDYDEYASILEKFTSNHAEIFCNCLALTNK